MSLPAVPLDVPTPKLRPIENVAEEATLVELPVLTTPVAPPKPAPLLTAVGTRLPRRVEPIRPPAVKALLERACQRGRICGGLFVRICTAGVPASFGSAPTNRPSTGSCVVDVGPCGTGKRSIVWSIGPVPSSTGV